MHPGISILRRLREEVGLVRGEVFTRTCVYNVTRGRHGRIQYKKDLNYLSVVCDALIYTSFQLRMEEIDGVCDREKV